jgi:gas vesicle structural protein
MKRRRSRRRPREDLLAHADASLLELVDHVLNRGVVVSGDVVLALAEVDLVYVRLQALLCAADRVLGGEGER